MNFKTWTVGIAVLALTSAPAFAEDNLGQWSFDEQVKPVSCCDSGCDCGDGCGCGSSVCGGGGLLSGMGPGIVEGFALADILGFDAIDVGGWTQFGYHDLPTPLSTTFNEGLSFNDVPNQLNLHQQWFYMGKEADGSNGFDWGFRADFIYGTDAQKTQAFGNTPGVFDEDWDFGEYGWAIPQLYGEIAINDLSVIVGHFFTLVGYEVVTAPDNFFYSHALTMFNSEPFTHTGVLTTYSGFENLTLYNGWTLGWDTGFDQYNGGADGQHGNIYLGGFSASLLDAVTMTYICTFGDFGFNNDTANGGGAGDSDYSHSVVFDVTLTDRLNYVFQTDYKKVDNTANTVEDLGINQYLFWQWNDIVSFGTRMEWWKHDDVDYNEVTGGVNIKLLDNLVMRPEYRKDWVPANSFEQNTFGCDFILTY